MLVDLRAIAIPCPIINLVTSEKCRNLELIWMHRWVLFQTDKEEEWSIERAVKDILYLGSSVSQWRDSRRYNAWVSLGVSVYVRCLDGVISLLNT